MKREIEFQSKGQRCRGLLNLPDEGKPPFPVLVMAGGWCYVKEIVMPHYAERFLSEGVASLLFDYRYMGESDGEPRQHIDPWAQIEDYKSAISFAEALPELDSSRIGIWGISYSGGHVLIVGATDPRVRCIVSTIPVVDGFETLRRDHGERGFARLLSAVVEDRRSRFKSGGGGGYIPMAAPDPDQTLCTWPYPHVYSVFTKIKESEAPRHQHRSTIESVELLLAYTVFPYVGRIVNVPTMMVVAEGDNLTSWDLEIAAFNAVTSPVKRLVVLPDVTHMSLYSERSHLRIAADEQAGWLVEHLAARQARSR